jgi:hypothetical protein
MSKEKWNPRWDQDCDNCDQSPVVESVDEEGVVTWNSGMCGPCTFGEAETIDPDKWGVIQ